MAYKFGTFKGVFVPSTEAILGTVLFLILPALVGTVGLFPMLAIIILAHTVTIATTFSLADCATNLNNIGAGGMYALARRSLGKAFGGSIGIQLYIAQAASIGFYCIGFIEPLHPIIEPILNNLPFIGDMSVALQKQVLSSLIFSAFFIVVMVGADFTLKIQMLILFILGGSVITIFISPLLGLKIAPQIGGEQIPLFNWAINSTGYLAIGKNALEASARPFNLAIFLLAFTQFFPAVTGIDAGVGMSGDLKNPKKSLVKGTFTAIIITFVVYLTSAFVYSLMDKVLLAENIKGQISAARILTDLMGFQKPFPQNITGIIVLFGILFATSSSALSCFMTAPRTAQSLSQNNTLPKFMSFLSKDIKKNGVEPRLATILTYFIGISVIWMGSINVAAMIVGICFLVVYGWVNGSAFLERISGNPSFRPTSKGHWAISLYGFASTLTAIILFDWRIGIGIIITQFVIFRLILKYKSNGKMEGVWWGLLFRILSTALASFRNTVQGSKNWRPVLTAFAFTGEKNCPENISYLARLIAEYKGLASMNIIASPEETNIATDKFLLPTSVVISDNKTDTISSIINASHPGGIEVNTVLLEYSKSISSVSVIQEIIKLNKHLLLLKNGESLFNHRIIDIWWRGENNGNLMVLLAYVISLNNKDESKIRIIRKISETENEKTAHKEMENLLSHARLIGEVTILPYSQDPFVETVLDFSAGADLIMMGLPGNFTETDKKRIFNLSEVFFNNTIESYTGMPPILFVKSAGEMELIEE